MAALTIIPENIFTSSFFFRAGETNVLNQPTPVDDIYSYAQVTPFIEDAEVEVSGNLSPFGYGFVNAQITASSGTGSLFSVGSDQSEMQIATINIALGKLKKVIDKENSKMFFDIGNRIQHNLKQKVLDPSCPWY